MTPLQAILLALVQGVTEFLPISSSAHLILVPYVFGWPDQGLPFDIAVNTGTLLAVVVYFRHDLVRLARAGLASVGLGSVGLGSVGLGRVVGAADVQPGDTKLAWAIVLGTIPVGACGLVFYDWISTAGRDPLIIAAASIGFGLLLWWADRLSGRERDLSRLTWRDVAVMGAFQALALIPGTSRSGITITAGLLLGFRRPEAARFSFLLAVPVGFLAAAKDLWDIVKTPPPSEALLWMAVSLVIAAVSAFFVIGWLLDWLQRQDMTPFVVYRVVLGLVILGVWWSVA